jgi:MFS family permease
MSIPLPGRTLPPVPGTFRALRHRDFRLLWAGQLVSLSGTWMQSVAQGWLVLRLSDSAFLLGLVGFCSYAPVLALSLLGGVAADRLPRRRALLVTQAAAMLQATALAVLALTGTIQVWHVAVLAALLGTVTAFDIPIRQALLQDLVGREDLANAIALNSTAFNTARLLGPAAAGFLIAAWGEAACFVLNALSFFAVLLGLAAMKAPPQAPGPAGPWLADLRAGLGYAAASAPVRTVLLLVAVSSAFGMSYSILMPAFARDVLGVGSTGLGLLMGASGVGSLAGALALASRRRVSRPRRVVAAAMTLFGLTLVAFSFSRSYGLSLALLAGVGASMIVQMATSNTFLQLTSPAEVRGRVVSLYTFCFVGMAPFGALLSGFLARALGVPAAVGLGGAVCALAGVVYGSRLRAAERLRRAAAAPGVNPPEPA